MDDGLKKDLNRFAKLSYEDFKRLAADPELSPYQRIGFPDSYREGFEPAIVEDMISKAESLRRSGGVVVDIGCGCTDVPRLLVEHCQRQGQDLVLIDSAEMLSLAPDAVHVKKVPGRFPSLPGFLDSHRGRCSTVIVYSVLHYVFEAGDLYGFVDAACSLLSPGGHLLIGDIPNMSKRRRFFASDAGVAFHKEFMKTQEPPQVNAFEFEPSRIDDGVVLGLILRYRNAGFDAYLMPQGRELPLRNRREDLLIVRP